MRNFLAYLGRLFTPEFVRLLILVTVGCSILAYGITEAAWRVSSLDIYIHQRL